MTRRAIETTKRHNSRSKQKMIVYGPEPFLQETYRGYLTGKQCERSRKDVPKLVVYMFVPESEWPSRDVGKISPRRSVHSWRAGGRAFQQTAEAYPCMISNTVFRLKNRVYVSIAGAYLRSPKEGGARTFDALIVIRS